MAEKTTLIQGMKKLKVIEKKIADNTGRIQQYAALPSTLKPQFGTDQAQREELNKLIQSNKDLVEEYLKLKKQVDMTNLTTKVQVGKQTYVLADLLMLRRSLGKAMIGTYMALNDEPAKMAVAQNRSKDVPIHVERYYDENAKYDGIKGWQAILDDIEIRLETINATTELVEL